MLKQFGELDPKVTEAMKYAGLQSLHIARELKAGRQPGPVVTEEEEKKEYMDPWADSTAGGSSKLDDDPPGYIGFDAPAPPANVAPINNEFDEWGLPSVPSSIAKPVVATAAPVNDFDDDWGLPSVPSTVAKPVAPPSFTSGKCLFVFLVWLCK